MAKIYDPERYDATIDLSPTSPIAGDVGFYLALAERAGGPVLDLGCGTGRVSLAIANAGIEVTGLDLDEGMLERARQKAEAAGFGVEFIQGDMAAFDLGRQFALIVVPFRAFQHLLEPAQQRACLAAIQRHLTPGGVFCVNLFVPWLDYCLEPGNPVPSPAAVIGERGDGNRIERIVEWRTNDTLRQVLVELWTHREYDSFGNLLHEDSEELSLRWTYVSEMALLMELAGFEVEGCYGDYRGGPVTAHSEQIWICYNPSQHNTFTGRLTEPMLDGIFQRATELAALDGASAPS